MTASNLNSDPAPPTADPHGQFQRELIERVRWLFGTDHGSRLAIASCALMIVLLWAVDWTTYPTLWDHGFNAWKSSEAMSLSLLLPSLAVAVVAVLHRTIPKPALIGALAVVALVGTGLVLALVSGAPGGDSEDPAHWDIGPFLALLAVVGSGLGMVRLSRRRGVTLPALRVRRAKLPLIVIGIAGVLAVATVVIVTSADSHDTLTNASTCDDWNGASRAERTTYIDKADVGAFPKNFIGLADGSCNSELAAAAHLALPGNLGEIRDSYLHE